MGIGFSPHEALDSIWVLVRSQLLQPCYQDRVSSYPNMLIPQEVSTLNVDDNKSTRCVATSWDSKRKVAHQALVSLQG
jgi:hypothetical protein